MSKTLILTVGLPKSGKTTWAQRQLQPVVNPDAIRLALHGQAFVREAEPHVWAIARTMVRHHFAYGHNAVILDATNLTQERRAEWVSPKEWELQFVVFDTPKDTCVVRAAELGFPIDVIERMAETMDLPSPEDRGVIAVYKGKRHP